MIISAAEHHSNIVPWQMLCEEKGAKLRVIPMNDRGELILEEARELLCSIRAPAWWPSRTFRTHWAPSNPRKRSSAMAHKAGALALIDGAQAAPHIRVNVQDLDADFYTLSGHKVASDPQASASLRLRQASRHPERHASLSGRRRHDQGSHVREDDFTPNSPISSKQGTPNIAGGIGLGAAFDYVNKIGLDKIAAYEHELLVYGTEALLRIPGLRIIGTAREKAAVLSFVVEGLHPHDIGTVLDQQGIAVRTGHHCAEPVMNWFHVPATTRASLAFYNTPAEIDVLADGIRKAKEVLA